jgi:hypothetical protein
MYAKTTRVSIDDTKHQIEKLLAQQGASRFGYATSASEAEVTFTLRNRFVRYRLLLPDPGDKAFTYTSSRRFRRTPEEAKRLHAQAVKARWRALHLVIKAKLEAIAAGIATFEEEFLAYTILPNGRTVAEHALPQIAKAYEIGTMAPLAAPALPALEGEAEVMR